MSERAKILVVEDDTSLSMFITSVLARQGYSVTAVPDGEAALELLDDGTEADLVLTDFVMPKMSGLDVLESVKLSQPKLPVIVMTAFSTSERTIEATKKGAFDFLLKPFEIDELTEVVEKALATHRINARPVAIAEGFAEDRDTLIGKSRPMQQIFKEIGRIATKPIPTLIRGETGTGKELIARAIYQHSDRSEAPFVAVNCAAIPENLIESELFGHERGAFTGAVSQRVGRFEQASGGTLFLDEIGDLPPHAQVALLRALQEKKITRVGSRTEIAVDVRVISATHRILPELIDEGRFREDLFYRLNGAEIQVPPLRERQDDIPELVTYFVAKYSREYALPDLEMSEEALARLVSHDWPGNIRQLENVVRRAMVEAHGDAITVEGVEKGLASAEGATADEAGEPEIVEGQEFAAIVRRYLKTAKQGTVTDLLETLTSKLEQEVFSQAYALADGNQSKVAQWVGVSRMTVRDKLHKYELHPKSRRTAPESRPGSRSDDASDAEAA